jgi:hypothetical protein
LLEAFGEPKKHIRKRPIVPQVGLGATVKSRRSSNRDHGIFLFDLSFANLDPGNNITGNNTNGGNALDVACFPQYTGTRGALANIGGGTNFVEL